MAKEIALLELTIAKEGVHGIEQWPAVDAASLDDSAWASLLHECTTREPASVTFLISRDLLQRKSSFFSALLGGDFRESLENYVKVTWDPVIFCFLLHCMCSGKLHLPCNMERLLEGVLFFGVEAAMPAIVEVIRNGNLLKWAPNLWSLAKGMGELSVAEACIESFAINFEKGISQSNLPCMPSSFLAACIDHKELTVTSEKSLCEAVLDCFLCKQNFHLVEEHHRIISAHPLASTDDEDNCDREENQIEENFSTEGISFYDIFQKVKIFLLPVDIVLGTLATRFPANMFLVDASELESYSNLYLHLEEVAGKTIEQLQNVEPKDVFTLRITKYSTEMDLAGCQQVTSAMLFQAVLHFLKHSTIEDLDAYLEVEAEVRKLLGGKASSLMPAKEACCRKLSLENLVWVNLESCWRIDQVSLVTWLCVFCPNLKFLDISHCPHLGVNILPQISLSCKYLEYANLSLYFKRPPVKTLLEATRFVNESSCSYLESYHTWGVLTCLTSLSLEGRSNLRDNDLSVFAKCCTNLSSVSLGGCSHLTDKGLAQFLVSLKSLTVLEAAYTAFGVLSVNALLCQSASTVPMPLAISCPPQSCGQPEGFLIGQITLTTLDLEGCTGMDTVTIAKLLSKAFLLKSLSLAHTLVDDSTIRSFKGTALCKLDLRETQVSKCGVAHIMNCNPSLKVLNIRGCRKAAAVQSVLECAEALRDEHALEESIFKGVKFENLAVGWGFSDSTLNSWKPTLNNLRSLSIGLGAQISGRVLGALYKVSPHLENLSISLQVISDSSIMSLVKNLHSLRTLELHQCLGEISRPFINMLPGNLGYLTLDRAVPWMTDTDMELLGTCCKGLTDISFVGCRLLTPKSLCTMASVWQGMKSLCLQECGTMTSNGGFCLLACKGLRQLTLQHNGAGLQSDFVKWAYNKLPLLQELCLDFCDSIDRSFTRIDKNTRSLRMLRIKRCKTVRNCFNDLTRRQYKDTLLIEWINTQEMSLVHHEDL